MQKTKMRCIQFLKSRKDTAEMLDLVEITLHQIPLAIPAFIVCPLRFGAWMWRNHHFHSTCQQLIHKGLSRIAAIRDHPLKGKTFNQALRLFYVVTLSGTQAVTQGLACRGVVNRRL